MLNVSADTEFAKGKMQGLNIPRALQRYEESCEDRMWAHYVDGYEFEETILREDGDDDLVISLRVVIK